MALPANPFENNARVKVVAGLETVGGGRGVFASVDIPAGGLILVERALVEPPVDKGEKEETHASLARALLQSQHRRELMDAVSHLHPVQLEDLPVEAVATARERYTPTIQTLQAISSEFDEPSLLRLLLAIQCNAFYSGFFVHCSMFNHACNPSCIKLAQPGGISEVRALRAIPEGEECTISYLSPPQQSHGRRLHHIYVQHYFHLPGPSPLPEVMESFQAPDPATAAEERSTSGTADQKQQLDELEDNLDKWEACLESVNVGSDELARSDLEAKRRLIEAAKAMLNQAQALLHPRHVVLARLHSNIVRASRLALLHSDELDMEDIVELTLLMLRSCSELRATQDLYLGPEHYDVAVTLQDTHQAIGFMLSNAPKALFAAFPQWSSFRKASSEEYKMKKRAEQISALYASN